VEAFTAAEVEVSTVAGVVVSTVEAVEQVSIARGEAADIAEAAHSGASGLSAEAGTVAALVADQRRATTDRAGVRTADIAHRAA
jgi:hypothetical protein